MKYIKKQNDMDTYLINLPNKQWKVYIISILAVNIFITIAFFILNIFSFNRLQQYSNEVLKKGDGTTVLQYQAGISTFTMTMVFLSAIIKFLYNFFFKGISLIFVTAVLIAMNLIYIVSHHMPYMLLAFIYSPVQASVTYLALILYTLCAYFLFSSYEGHIPDKLLLKLLTAHIKRKMNINNLRFFKYLLRAKPLLWLYVSMGIFFAVFYFTVIFVYIITLGSFDDFKVAQNLAIPLVIGIFTFVGVKPIYKKAAQSYSSDSSSNTRNHIEEYISRTRLTTSRCKLLLAK